MILNISEGESLDRLTILEIKNNVIKDEQKKLEIDKELIMYSSIIPIKHKYIYLYKLLYFINKMIWDLTDIVKKMHSRDKEYADIAFQIFDLNQQRFRIKNIINHCEQSTIKEQKNYESQTVYILLDGININDDIYMRILYLYLLYDNVKLCYKSSEYIKILDKILPNIQYYEHSNNNKPYIDINSLLIPDVYNTSIHKILS